MHVGTIQRARERCRIHENCTEYKGTILLEPRTVATGNGSVHGTVKAKRCPWDYCLLILNLFIYCDSSHCGNYSYVRTSKYVHQTQLTFNFKVCRSVHHRTIQINHQPGVTIFQFIILTFIYSSSCFGCFPANHQELNDCSGSLWFYLCIVVTFALCSWSGRLSTGPTTNAARLSL